MVLKKIAPLIASFLIPVSIAVLVACVFLLEKTNPTLRPMALLPFVYLLCLIFSSCVYRAKNVNPFLTLIHLFYAVQFLIIPLMVFIDGDYNWSNYNPDIKNHIFEAALLQGFVLVVLTVLFAFQKNDEYHPIDFSNKYDTYQTRNTLRLIAVLLVASVLLIIVYPQILLKFRLIKYSSVEDYHAYLRASEGVKGSMPLLIYEFGLLLLKIVKLLLSYYLVVLIKRRVGVKHPVIGIVLSFLIIGLSCLVTTEDKAAYIFSGIACLLLVAKFYPKESLAIIKVSAVLMALLIAVVFVAPMFSSSNSMNLSYSFNAYFEGTINVSGGFLMEGGDKVRMFVGDVLRSVPYLNHFFLHLPMSYIEFNSAIGYDTVYNSEIVPMISQGYFYFGLVGAALFPFILLVAAKAVLKKTVDSSGSFEFYAFVSLFLYLFLGVFLYDFALVISQVLNYCVPIMFVFVFTKRRKRFNEESIAIFKRKQYRA